MAGVCWGVSVGLGEGWSCGCFMCCTLSPAAPRQLSSVVDHSPCACRKPQDEADTPLPSPPTSLGFGGISLPYKCV